MGGIPERADLSVTHSIHQDCYKTMSRNIIGEPDKFELASVVTKNSRTGITSNRRLLVIKGGKLFYYSIVPKFFNGDTKALQNSHQLPKSSIDIMNIKKVNGFDPASPFFSIQFDSGQMMEKNDIRNSAMRQDYNFAPKDTQQQITWQFTCDNQFIKQRWVSALNNLKEYYKQENIQMQKFMQTIENNSHPPEDPKSGSSYSSRSSIRMPVPWRDSGITRRSYNPDKGFQFKDNSPKFENGNKIEDIAFLKKNQSDQRFNNGNAEFEMIIEESPSALTKTNSMDKKFQRVEDAFKISTVTKKTTSILINQDRISQSPPPPISQPQLQQPQQQPQSQLRFQPQIQFQPQPQPQPQLQNQQQQTQPKPHNQPQLQPLPITIQELQQDMSISQTPIKDHSISYNESQDYTDGRKSVEKTLADLKLFADIHQTKRDINLIKKDTNQSKKQALQTKAAIPQIKKNISQIKRDMRQIKREEQYRYNQKRPQNPAIMIHQDQEQVRFNSFHTEQQFTPLGKTNQPTIDLIEDKSYLKRQHNNDQQLYPFQWLWGQSLRGQNRFQQRIHYQKQLLSYMLNFKERAIQSVSSWLESKANGQNRYPIIQQSNRYIVLQVGNIILKVANISTQKLFINGSQKIFYNEDCIKNLKRQYKIQQNLFKIISKRLKTQNSLKMRIPLSVFIEYRGVVCIATRHHSEEQQISSIEDEEWTNESIFLNQQGYKSEYFNFKKISRYLQISIKSRGKHLQKDQQNLRQYLKKMVLIGRREKHHNLIFDPPIDKTFLQIANKENASTSIQSLQRYVKGLKLAKNLQGPCPKQQMISALVNCIFCKQLRKIYRSAQGQINQTHFFNLIFKRQPTILNLLEQSNCQLPQKIQGQIFTFLQHYFGLMLQVDEKIFAERFKGKQEIKSKKDIFVSSTARPIVREYSMDGFQIIESYSKLQFYLQNKHPLGPAALQKKRQIFRLNQNLTLDQYLQLLYDQACFKYYESDFTGCIKKCKQFQQSSPIKSTKLFSVYLLMMKAYSQFSQVDFSVTFKKANDLIQFNYGSQNSSLINLYSLAAFYYERLSQKPNISKGLNLTEIYIKLIKQAQHLCMVCFGINSKQYLDILLDVSKLYRGVDLNVTLACFQQAKRLCQNNPLLFVPQNLILLLSYETELYLRRTMISQAEVTLAQALSFLDAKTSLKSKIHLHKLQYEVGFYAEKFEHCEAAIQKLWQLGTYEKLQALQLAYRTAYRETGVSQSQSLIDQTDSVRYQGHEKGFVQLEQMKHKFNSLVDMLMNAVQTRNLHTLTLVYYLIHRY